ncbi:MAG TPA: sigma 54-interacting transcriptional regulator [Firmicutes bacterium]|jgi:arginine utilization regulatory protein|nr:sigma 54-interacting transcriptional regulator [Bacillota bacterium]
MQAREQDRDLLVAILEQAVNEVDVGIHVVDQKGCTLIYNKAMAYQEGLDQEQVLGRPLLEVFPDLNHDSSTLLQVLARREPIREQEQTYMNIRGDRITAINTTIPLYVKGKFVGALEMARDITKIRNLAERVVALQQRLWQSKHNGRQTSPAIYTFHDIVGKSPLMQAVLQMAAKAAQTDSTILLYGETGTGKELVAQSIHNASPRKKEPFIAQNCAALPKSLLEGILFGTTRGAFTGAVDRAGLFEQASGGTLLLDEINTLSWEMQAKLLRVLQEKRVRRLGGHKETGINTRIIATLSVDPQQAIADGALREDLYYRLNVVSMRLPPLRERKEDIPLLVSAFLAKYNKHLGRNVKRVAPAVWQMFWNYQWPGNVRQLEHAIEGALNIIGEEEELNISHLPSTLQQNVGETAPRQEETLPAMISRVEKEMIQTALTATGNNISQAAQRLGIKRQALQYKIKKYNLQLE